MTDHGKSKLTAAEQAEHEAAEAKRREDRVTINKEFESFDAFIHEYVTNISRSGVFVKSKQPLPVGTRVNLKFTVIMDDIETIEGVGEVVRARSHEFHFKLDEAAHHNLKGIGSDA